MKKSNELKVHVTLREGGDEPTDRKLSQTCRNLEQLLSRAEAGRKIRWRSVATCRAAIEMVVGGATGAEVYVVVRRGDECSAGGIAALDPAAASSD